MPWRWCSNSFEALRALELNLPLDGDNLPLSGRIARVTRRRYRSHRRQPSRARVCWAFGELPTSVIRSISGHATETMQRHYSAVALDVQKRVVKDVSQSFATAHQKCPHANSYRSSAATRRGLPKAQLQHSRAVRIRERVANHLEHAAINGPAAWYSAVPPGSSYFRSAAFTPAPAPSYDSRWMSWSGH